MNIIWINPVNLKINIIKSYISCGGGGGVVDSSWCWGIGALLASIWWVFQPSTATIYETNADRRVSLRPFAKNSTANKSFSGRETSCLPSTNCYWLLLWSLDLYQRRSTTQLSLQRRRFHHLLSTFSPRVFFSQAFQFIWFFQWIRFMSSAA